MYSRGLSILPNAHLIVEMSCYLQVHGGQNFCALSNFDPMAKFVHHIFSRLFEFGSTKMLVCVALEDRRIYGG